MLTELQVVDDAARLAKGDDTGVSELEPDDETLALPLADAAPVDVMMGMITGGVGEGVMDGVVVGLAVLDDVRVAEAVRVGVMLAENAAVMLDGADAVGVGL